MTELVDRIKVEITLHHCKDGLQITPLRSRLDDLWQSILNQVRPCTEGHKEWEGGAIEVRWEHTGLHEIPEEGGGDN